MTFLYSTERLLRSPAGLHERTRLSVLKWAWLCGNSRSSCGRRSSSSVGLKRWWHQVICSTKSRAGPPPGVVYLYCICSGVRDKTILFNLSIIYGTFPWETLSLQFLCLCSCLLFNKEWTLLSVYEGLNGLGPKDVSNLLPATVRTFGFLFPESEPDTRLSAASN